MSADMQIDKFALLKQALEPDRLCFLEETAKEGAILTVAAMLATSPEVHKKDELVQAVFNREQIMSTGIGLGLAVPHVRLESVKNVVMAVGFSPAGIGDYASLDDKPVHMIFLIAAPEGHHADYLRLLSAISYRAKMLHSRLMQCGDAKELYRLLADVEDTARGVSA